jgi:nucleoside-diphosphate-sugar epimerase
MKSDFTGPVNIGSEEMVTINDLVDIASSVESKTLSKKHVDGPTGVRGRNSNNDLVREKLQWDYSISLKDGITKTYNWIKTKI